jgi:phage terminase large subunit-like protein
MTRATTRSSAHNLAPGFVDEMERSYSGVAHLRSQELEGVLVEDPKDALWTRAMIEDRRVTRAQAGEMERVVVAIDPPAGMAGDACGIVAAGRRGGVVYVLADASVRGMRPLSWAGRAVALAREMGAGLIVAEANQGGEMVREVLMSAGARGACRVKLVHAKENKWARAQPVCAAYEGGEVVHAGVHRELEDEMCAFGATGAPSPDRVDAMVWAVRELTAPGPKPGIFRL